MFRHYFIMALRRIARHRLYSFINIGGLSISLACTIFVVLFVRNELSYDRWVPGSADLYRAELTYQMPGRPPVALAQAPYPLLQAMVDHIPEVAHITHVVPERMTVSIGDRQFAETVTVVDPEFFQVIKLALLEGAPGTVLADPESVVLSQSTAHKYFGDADPVGQTVMLSAADGWACNHEDSACLSAAHAVRISGVMANLPNNTQLVADVVLPNTSKADVISESRKTSAWTSTDGSYAYVSLASNADPDAVLKKLQPLLDQTISPADLKGMRASDLEHYRLTPFWQVHLTSDNFGGMRPPGSLATVHGLCVIAALIVLVACCNFMNLATARAMLRSREVAMRKAVGATRWQLVLQFLTEAVLTALLSLIVGLALVEILLPVYNGFLDQSIQFNYWVEWRLLLALFLGAVGAGLLSGLYPAFVLSRFQPAASLHNSTAGQSGSAATRMVLVVLQFAASIGLGIAALVIFSQISFARHFDLGFERDGIVVLRGLTKLTTRATESFAQALGADPDVAAVALSNGAPFDLINVSNDMVEIPGQAQSFNAHVISVSPEFTSVYNIRLLAGRFLSTEYGQDMARSGESRNVLMNLDAVRRCGYTAAEAIGKSVAVDEFNARIVGVVADARLDGIRDTVVPTVYQVAPADYTMVSIRLRSGQMAAALPRIDKIWRSFAPFSATQRYFLSEAFDSMFKAEEKRGTMFGIFVTITIVIGCLGLFGLAAFTTERRTKEIGIRKVFGARTVDLLYLLLWQFSIPVLIANLIAWPVAYYYLNRWLEGYSVRIYLSPLYFLAAGALALLIAWATVFVHALRIAHANPIFALRHE